MERDLTGQRSKKRYNPILIFVSVFYLVFGLLFAAMGVFGAYAFFKAGSSGLQTQGILALALMLVLGAMMFTAALRGFRGRGSYITGAVLLLLGALLVYIQSQQSGFEWISVSTVTLALGVLYLVGTALSHRR